MESFFTVAFSHIPLKRPVTFDLFVNSSSQKGREHYVKIIKASDLLSEELLFTYREKYHQLYVPETQRELYLQTLLTTKTIRDEEKALVLKNSAIFHLEGLFKKQEQEKPLLINETLSSCRNVVSHMVTIIREYSAEKLYNMIGSLSYHDFYTFDHSINVSLYCICILHHLTPEVPDELLVTAGLSGLLHDIGKLKISTELINYPGNLTVEQYNEIKKHPVYGKQILDEGQGVHLPLIKKVVAEHHENFNGTGYPGHLEKNDIHLFARITSIADFFDAITTKRSYHEPLSIEQAIDVMGKSSGEKLDPKLFAFFAGMLKVMAKRGRTPFLLPGEFDPCRPYKKLPFLHQNPKEQRVAALKGKDGDPYP